MKYLKNEEEKEKNKEGKRKRKKKKEKGFSSPSIWPCSVGKVLAEFFYIALIKFCLLIPPEFC